ncbi:TRAM domain-containing protein [Halorientalis pallida]|uniref:TRAM domain-containing protein n=1 Tax=Halorientalis pallida TaxID=2479928 RepID=A0A498KVZ7_9EURY|nr:TRAM domain-containing protein [Halorientalis pallida]RXK47889.1 TRAM domain-containing protein [Halorientalis pallida]
MDILDQLRCLFSATLEERDGSYVLEVPTEGIQRGNISQGGTYRVAVLSSRSTTEPVDTDTTSQFDSEPQEPPVTEGEHRTVEIESIGDRGDGITRVERGFVVIVSETEQGERVTIEITGVREDVAFADVVERISYYD